MVSHISQIYKQKFHFRNQMSEIIISRFFLYAFTLIFYFV